MPLSPEAAAAIQDMVGVRYVWGGTDRLNGVDCSGFTQLIYGAMGIKLPRVSADQARSGQAVSMAEAQPGDLVWWDLGDRNNGADHVGVYLGNGQVAEASSSRGQVVIRKLWGNAQFTRLGGGEASGGTSPSPTGQPVDTTIDMNEAVRSPESLRAVGQDEGSGKASFNLDFLYRLSDDDDPGETPETVGSYGVARMILKMGQGAAQPLKQAAKEGL